MDSRPLKTFDETARAYRWVVGELEQIAQHPDPAARAERIADLFLFYLTDVIENNQLASLVEAAIGDLLRPDAVRRVGDLEASVSLD